jgi:nucleoid-associated protein YgaU
MLQQELALTRAQGDALRSAIENRAADGDTSKRLTEKLNQTARELAALRADYAKLQLERGAAPAATPKDIADLTAKLGATEDRLASTLRNFTQLQDEVGRLRTDLDKTRTENLALTDQVKVITAKNEEAQAALAALNADLLTQKETRVRAEQDAATLRTQLDSANTKLTALAQQRTAPAAEARGLAPADAKPGDENDVRVQLDSLRKKVWSLESERNELQQQLSAIESAGKAPGLAEIKARADTAAKLTAALNSAKMLRDENDQLKANVETAAKARATLEAELASARAAVPLAAQAGTLREQLRAAQAQATTLVEENSKLKARLAVVAGSGGNPGNLPTESGSAPSSNAQPSSPMNTGVTATFVANVAGPSGAAASGATNVKTRTTTGGALRFHNVAAGDTLSKISNLYYGTPTRWAEILVANRDILGEDNNLVVGRTLRIP